LSGNRVNQELTINRANHALSYTHLVPTKFPKSITILGILCVTIGVSWGFIDVSTGFRFTFFDDHAEAFLATLAVGVLLSSGGTLVWTRHFSKSAKFKIAGWIFFAGLIAVVVAPKNVHGPGMLLLFAAVCACILSVILTIAAFATGDPQSQ
jgi:hypothetical protein